MADLSIIFAFPGELETQTGGYRYDRLIIEELRSLGIKVETLSLPKSSLLLQTSSRQEIQQKLASLPDRSIVIIDGLAYGVLDDLAVAEAERLRIIALCHHPLAFENGLSAQKKKDLLHSEQRALQSARATIVTSHFTKQLLVDQFDLAAEKIVVALPGTDKVSFAPCNGDPVRLLTVAALIQRKGHDVLIDALASLKNFSWQARFVGGADFDPDWASSLQESVDQLGLSARISFDDSVEDIRNEYQNADVFVLPSRFEGYGMVFAEALAAGLPVVGANSGAVSEVVPKEAGLLVPPDDCASLTEALREILSNDSTRRRLQAGAQKAASGLPSWQESAQVMARTLREVYAT
ncbi:MAG: glycosyltransferase [Pseudomonadales bacterium]|nr:glycosyltransferase [Pseudomonadales bacterium]